MRGSPMKFFIQMKMRSLLHNLFRMSGCQFSAPNVLNLALFNPIVVCVNLAQQSRNSRMMRMDLRSLRNHTKRELMPTQRLCQNSNSKGFPSLL